MNSNQHSEENAMKKQSITCIRCGRAYDGKGDWNATFVRGVVTGYVCPDDQTDEENAEAVVNEATGASNVGHVVSPGDPGYAEAMAQHAQGVADDVLRERLTQIANSRVPMEFNPIALADETMRRLRETLMNPPAELHSHFVKQFQEFAREARE